MARTLRTSCAVLLVLIAPVACATEQGGTVGDLARAADAASSAAATGYVTTSALVAGDVTTGVADTALTDMIGASQDAEVAVAGRVVESPRERDLRQDALTLIRAGTDALVAARAWVGLQDGPPGAIVDALSTSAEDLTAFSDAHDPS